MAEMPERLSLEAAAGRRGVAVAATGAGASFWHRHARLIFPAPAMLTAAALLAFPIAYTLWMSLQDWFASSLTPPRFTGLDNYVKVLTDDLRFREAVVRTFAFTVLAVVLELAFGVAMALLFNRRFWGRGILRTLALLPMVATPVAIALVFMMMYHPTLGVMNYLLSLVGLPAFLWVYSSKTVLFALALVDVWEWTPLIMLITLAGLAALPPEPYESALLDGATAWQAFWRITLPLLRPTLVVAVLFRAIDALKTFDIIFVMTQGGPSNASETINIYLFTVGFSYFQMGYASSMVVVFFAVILGVSLLLLKVRRGGA